ncbi:MAG: BON domain-containing protein [Trinickia sp.]|uniref:BON domain-containing protein n=1 Tax=Trinickia sp. TaxID=2571163 RepID=UPI003F81A947
MKSDAQLKREVEDELKWAEGVPSDAIHVRVDRGCVTLTGEVDWGAQRHTAELVASRTLGVIGVMNQIAVKRDADPVLIAEQIAAALERHALNDAKRLQVDVKDGVVTLRGEVGSQEEKRAIHGVACASFGVREVVDLTIVV